MTMLLIVMPVKQPFECEICEHETEFIGDNTKLEKKACPGCAAQELVNFVNEGWDDSYEQIYKSFRFYCDDFLTEELKTKLDEWYAAVKV